MLQGLFFQSDFGSFGHAGVRCCNLCSRVGCRLIWTSLLKLAASAEIAIVNLFMKDTGVKRVICCICHFYLIFKVGLILFSALPPGATMRFPLSNVHAVSTSRI